VTIWDGVVGQPDSVERLRRSAGDPLHAYLFVGPPGSTKDEAARAFAAAVLTAGAEDPDQRDARLALAGEHPDIREVQRAGPFISAEQAREIVRVAALAPIEGERKVLILHEFHLLRPEGAALLLKTLEEPPDSTTFVVLADFVPPELVTISSRCVRVEFRAIPDPVLTQRLLREGISADHVRDVVAAAGGDLTRARVLARDPSLAARRRAFADVPHHLDGSGAVAMALVDELVGLIDDAAAPLTERHAAELADLEARVERLGERGSGRKAMEERQQREVRRYRMDELRSGLAVLAGSYRDALVAAPERRAGQLVAAVHRIFAAIEALERNPNEKLLLQALLWALPGTRPDDAALVHASVVGAGAGRSSTRSSTSSSTDIASES
jgi:DNA polymerase-3 subunit delta'